MRGRTKVSTPSLPGNFPHADALEGELEQPGRVRRRQAGPRPAYSTGCRRRRSGCCRRPHCWCCRPRPPCRPCRSVPVNGIVPVSPVAPVAPVVPVAPALLFATGCRSRRRRRRRRVPTEITAVTAKTSSERRLPDAGRQHLTRLLSGVRSSHRTGPARWSAPGPASGSRSARERSPVRRSRRPDWTDPAASVA